MSDADGQRWMEELLRDLRSRVLAFSEYHPEFAGSGMVLELTMFDERRQSVTASSSVGHEPSRSERTGLALGKLRQAAQQLDELQGPQSAITSLSETIEHLITIYEGGT